MRTRARDAAIEAAKAEFRWALEAAGVSRVGVDFLVNALMGGIGELPELEACGRVKYSDPAKRNAVWNAAVVFDGRLDNVWTTYG